LVKRVETVLKGNKIQEDFSSFLFKEKNLNQKESEIIFTCKNRRSSSHCFTGITLSLASFHSLATTTATLFAVTLARANSRSSVFLSSYIVSKQAYAAISML